MAGQRLSVAPPVPRSSWREVPTRKAISRCGRARATDGVPPRATRAAHPVPQGGPAHAARVARGAWPDARAPRGVRGGGQAE